jgi:hypothetical protein
MRYSIRSRRPTERLARVFQTDPQLYHTEYTNRRCHSDIPHAVPYCGRRRGGDDVSTADHRRGDFLCRSGGGSRSGEARVGAALRGVERGKRRPSAGACRRQVFALPPLGSVAHAQGSHVSRGAGPAHPKSGIVVMPAEEARPQPASFDAAPTASCAHQTGRHRRREQLSAPGCGRRGSEMRAVPARAGDVIGESSSLWL